jgi:hypothetical protein
MTSSIAIANQALLLLGKNTIQSFDEQTAEARTAKAFYETTRDHVLRDIKPPFLITRTELVAQTPPIGATDMQSFAYAIPADALLVMSVAGTFDYGTLTWVVEGNQVLTNFAASWMRYLKNVDGVEDLMDASLVKAVAAYLAGEMSYTLTENSGKLGAMMQIYGARKEEAQNIYGQAQSTQQTTNTQLLLNR